MNTSIDLKIRLGNSLLKHVVSNYQSSTLEFILAQHIMDMEQGKTTEQLDNSSAVLQRDYAQLSAALSLKNSECIDLTAERDRLQTANANGTEVLAKTRDELAFLQDQLDGYHGKGKTPRAKRELKADPPVAEEFVWVNPPEVGETE